MQKWEYRFVNTEWRVDAWYVLSVNGQSAGDWDTDETMYEYSNRMGEDGWELVALRILAMSLRTIGHDSYSNARRDN